MSVQFTLEYWLDEGWYAGRLREWPGVISQGETLEELEENIQDAYQLMLEACADDLPENSTTKPILLQSFCPNN